MSDEYIRITERNSNEGIERLDFKIDKKNKYVTLYQGEDYTWLTFKELDKIIKEYKKEVKK